MGKKYKLSTLQKKIIEHLENQIRNRDTKLNIRKKFEKTYTKSGIYKSINRLETREVLEPTKTRSLFSEGEIVKYHISVIVALNTKSIIYKKYKERLQNR